MTIEPFLSCPVCAADVYIVAAMVDGHLLYQGKCTHCDVVAQESSNYQRALDFWNAWHAPDPAPEPEAPPAAEDAPA